MYKPPHLPRRHFLAAGQKQDTHVFMVLSIIFSLDLKIAAGVGANRTHIGGLFTHVYVAAVSAHPYADAIF
jgi:hypothetical protein